MVCLLTTLIWGSLACGVVHSGDGISSINPDDIEKITVLKGAAAAALYGFRASNGAVLITTKSGSKRKGIGVEINSNFVMDEAISFTDWQTEYGIGSRGVKPVTLQEAQDYGNIAWGGKLDGSSVIQFDGVNRPYSYAGNAMDNFYETGTTFTNTLTLTGGGEMANFRFSASDLRNESVIPNSGLNRNTYGTNIHLKLDKFSAYVSGTYVRQEMKNSPRISDFPENANAMVRNFPSSLDIRTLKGDPEKLGADPVTGGEYLASSNIWWGNPFWAAHQDERIDSKNRIYGNIRLRYDLTDWLYVQGRIGLDSYNATRTHLTPTGQGFRPGGSLSLRTTRFEEINNDVICGIRLYYKGI